MAEENITPVTPERNEFECTKVSKSSAGSQSFDSFKTRDDTRCPSTRVPRYLRASARSCHDNCKHGRKHSSQEEARTRISKPLSPKTVVKPVNSKCSVLAKPSSGSTLSAANRSDAESASPRQNVSSDGDLGSSPAKKSVSLHSRPTIKGEVVLQGKFVHKNSCIKTASIERSKPGRQTLVPSLKDRSKVHGDETGTSNSEAPEKIMHVMEVGVDAKAHQVSSEDGDVKCTSNELESISIDHPAKPSLSSSSESLSPSKFPPPTLSCKEDDEGITCEDQKSGEFVVENDKSGPVRKKHSQTIIKINCGRNVGDIENTKSKKIVETPSLKENCNKNPISRRAVPLEGKDKHTSPTKLNFRQGRALNLQPLDHAVSRTVKFRQPGLTDTKPCESASNKSKSMKTTITDPNKKPINNKKSSGSQEAAALPSGNNLTRGLRLKSARSQGNENGSLRRRPFKTKNNGSRDEAAGDSAEICSLKTRLKHRAVQRKKVARVLLNNVIEETASKLVKSRKSKVKALVGAFETVISLQELQTK